jgi:hypothetical protein
VGEIDSVEENMTNKPSKVFVSYSYDSDEHKKWVEELAKRLRSDGVDVMLDRWQFQLGKPSGLEMNRAIAEPDRVLCICTDEYVRRVDAGEGGAGYEGFLITAELTKDAGTDKFIPVIRNVKGKQKTPSCLDGRIRIDLSDGAGYEDEYETLLRHLHGAVEIPPIGENPFSKSANKRNAPPPISDAKENNLNDPNEIQFEHNKDYKTAWTTRLASLDQQTTDDRVAHALSQSKKGVQIVKEAVSNIITEAKGIVENLKLNSIELRIKPNSDKDLEIVGPEGRILQVNFIHEFSNSLQGSRLFADIVRLEGRRQDQPFEHTEGMEFTPLIDSSGRVSWGHGDEDSKKQLDNSGVLSLIFERFTDILRTDRNSRRQRGLLW